MKSKISIITLGVSDFNKSFDFYSKGLGFKPYNHYKEGDDYVMLEMEGSWLSLFSKEKLAADATIPNDGSGFSGVTLAQNVKSVDEVDEVFKLAVSNGAKAIKTPRKTNWGGYSGYFADPDGYLWEVAYNPFTDLT